MTTPDELRGLIERLKRTEGPDGLLDPLYDTCFLDREIGKCLGFQPITWKPYTSSLDVALTLVPDGRWWIVNSGVECGPPSATIDAGEAWQEHRAYGKTPALALCIAALRARLAQVEEEKV